MRTATKLAVFLGAVCCTAQGVAAQSAQRFSIQLSGITESLFGDDFEGVEDGGGAELQLRYRVGALSIGAGGQFTSHALEEDEDVSIELAGVFIEPRYALNEYGELTPYLSARLSNSALSTTYREQTVDADGRGTSFNVGGGAVYRLGSRLNLDAGLTFGLIRWPSLQLGQESLGQISATNLIGRLGIAYGFGQ